ncbi:dephospho-CoA kinase [Ignatzschineria sp. LJL83]
MKEIKKRDVKLVLLTGGIASGKTFASDYLGRKGAVVIDTDIISKQLTCNDNDLGVETLQEIKDAFGGSFFTDQGEMDRVKMRSEVFNNSFSKKTLESILHRRIYQEVERRMTELSVPEYGLIVVPVINKDSAYLKLVDEVLVIEVFEELQLQRLMARDNIDQDLAEKIINSQISRLDRRKLGDYIIISQNKDFVEKQLDKLHNSYSKTSVDKSDLNKNGEKE